MELKLNIGYNEIWELVKQLPKSQILQLKTDIETQIIDSAEVLNETTKQEDASMSRFREKLLQTSVWTDDEIAVFEENRKLFNKWTIEEL